MRLTASRNSAALFYSLDITKIQFSVLNATSSMSEEVGVALIKALPSLTVLP